MRRRRPFGLHAAAAGWIDQGGHLVNLEDRLCPAFGRHISRVIFYDGGMTWKVDELFPQQRVEDLMGEDFLDELVMEKGDMLEGTIRSCASLGNQDVDINDFIKSSLLCVGRIQEIV